MLLIDRIHEFFSALGVSPKVVDPFIGAVALVAFHWITTGSLDVDGLRLAIGLFVLGVLGVAAPPAVGWKQSEIGAVAVNLRRRRRQRVD